MLSYALLFVYSFLAGSILPFGSEPYLVYLYQSDFSPTLLIFFSGMGNTLGGMSCYLMALYGGPLLINKYFKSASSKVEHWHKRLESRSEWVALFCWLPVIGEVIALSLGMISRRYWRVFIFMGVGKTLRYFLLLKSVDLFLFV